MARPLSSSQLFTVTSTPAITASVMGFQRAHVGFPASLSSCLPILLCGFDLDLLYTGLRILKALRYG